MAGVFLFASHCLARDARDVGEWLCSHVFEGGGATAAFTCDGFFGMRIETPQKPQQDITGLWRLEGDGIELKLYTLQDAEIHATVGARAIHAALAGEVQVSLEPSAKKSVVIKATGLVEKDGSRQIFIDGASGREFPLSKSSAENGKFATVELSVGSRGASAQKVISHSGKVPRFFTRPPAESGLETFINSVCSRYWLMPQLPNAPQGALRFARPQLEKAPADMTAIGKGAFEITGQGLRCEGSYMVAKGKLTLIPGRDSLQNIKLIGAGAILDALKGTLDWRLSPRGLELGGIQKLLLLPYEGKSH